MNEEEHEDCELFRPSSFERGGWWYCVVCGVQGNSYTEKVDSL